MSAGSQRRCECEAFFVRQVTGEEDDPFRSDSQRVGPARRLIADRPGFDERQPGERADNAGEKQHLYATWNHLESLFEKRRRRMFRGPAGWKT